MMTSNGERPLSGQSAIVTGGGRGLGRWMAEALAAAGAAVAVVGRNPAHLDEIAALIRQDGGQALAVSADVADPQAVRRMVEQVEQAFGKVDLLVNNAGIVGAPGPFWEANADDWWQVFEVNLRGPFLCASAVMPGMVARKSGRIINVASSAARRPIPYGSQYATSKAALARLTEQLAIEGQEHGVKAFVIDPGNVFTDMSNYLIHSEPGRKYVPRFGEFMLSGNDDPPGRSADLVVLLASGRLDGLSGRFISISDDADKLAAHTAQILEQDLYALRMKPLP